MAIGSDVTPSHKERMMGIPELARLLQIATNQGGTGYVVVVQDEDGDVYPRFKG
jgi:hypothetical protein